MSRPIGGRPGATPSWIVITELGRTDHINSTDGTDHGITTVALLAGAALKGCLCSPIGKQANLQARAVKPMAGLLA